ncbi:hypothetical protein EJ05DRAFT_475629 [Pseudovirgaria hyperparasitica]|uniref:RING-type domain-containing protein n=1 Tax=Pseudovirgaria hyperparasitica TaxID=470096 RepID=A0A6A6W7W5_9PEZI|nr:uncharacterized protein EJ05DRAFT_475629 [Pseudovirgaria hyperparasitica]KAF2758299.1 hypothetical protein EJ05DRAFT_475629 [Pseudovirgaria hyperparasitica]
MPNNSHSIVDLTTPVQGESQGQSSPMSSPEVGPSTKRIRKNNGASQSKSTSYGQQSVMSSGDEDPLVNVSRKQQVTAMTAPEEQIGKPLRMSNLRCVICFESPTNLAVTTCGHWFCHTCIMETLIAGEARVAEGEARRSQCPICRKTLNRQKAADVFPALLMKKGQATQPRRTGRVTTRT